MYAKFFCFFFSENSDSAFSQIIDFDIESEERALKDWTGSLSQSTEDQIPRAYFCDGSEWMLLIIKNLNYKYSYFISMQGNWRFSCKWQKPYLQNIP